VFLRLRVRLLLLFLFVAKAKATCKSKSNRKSKRKSKSKSKRLSIVTHELNPTPAVGSNPTPGDFRVEIFGVGCLPTPGIKSPVWDPTPRILVWDSQRASTIGKNSL